MRIGPRPPSEQDEGNENQGHVIRVSSGTVGDEKALLELERDDWMRRQRIIQTASRQAVKHTERAIRQPGQRKNAGVCVERQIAEGVGERRAQAVLPIETTLLS